MAWFFEGAAQLILIKTLPVATVFVNRAAPSKSHPGYIQLCVLLKTLPMNM